MSELPDTLYTKYRPKEFSEVIGQAGIVRSLKSVIASRSNRTFLLSGPSGTGKTTLARIAADIVGTEQSDLVEVDAATFTGIDDMRQITSSLMYRPLGKSGGAKTIIVDECHALSKAAWGSLLKSLEEPPSWVYWFLCTTDPAKVPANIQTRCTKYELKAVATADLEELLLHVVENEALEIGASVKEARKIIDLCAKQAHGSPRAALVNLGACAKARSREEANELLKAVDDEGSQAFELARALVAKRPWMQVSEILTGLAQQSPESVRHVVRAYVTKVILGSNGKDQTANFAILDAFSQPFPASDQNSPLVLAVGKLMFL